MNEWHVPVSEYVHCSLCVMLCLLTRWQYHCSALHYRTMLLQYLACHYSLKCKQIWFIRYNWMSCFWKECANIPKLDMCLLPWWWTLMICNLKLLQNRWLRMKVYTNSNSLPLSYSFVSRKCFLNSLL